MKEFFRNLYDGLLSLFSATLEEVQNIHGWFRKQEEKAKEYKKDFKKYMDTGEIDTIKYGTSKKSKFQRKWRTYDMHKHFSAAHNIDMKKKLREYKAFMEKYGEKLGFGIAKLFKKDKYRYNETQWTPIPYGYEIKKLIGQGTFSKYITSQERKNIWNLRRQGKFGYHFIRECIFDGLMDFFGFNNVNNFEIMNDSCQYDLQSEFQFDLIDKMKGLFNIKQKEEKKKDKKGKNNYLYYENV